MEIFKRGKVLNHHAYFLIGDVSKQDTLISILEKNYLVSSRSNPDFFMRNFETFTIDDAREIKSLHNSRPVVLGGLKIFIITMNNITIEAQNALLKLLEEPSQFTHFFIIMPSSHLLLPTVKSRLHFLDCPLETRNRNFSSEISDFVGFSTPKRLEFIKSMLDDISKENINKQSAVNFLDELQYYIYEKNGIDRGSKMLETIEISRKYINDRSPSMKMLLEFVALNV